MNIVEALSELKSLKPKQEFIVRTEELLRMKAKKLSEGEGPQKK
ncbi:hypothetical protein [Cytobacillus sp. FSL R5-0596]|nr:hypothetical protein KIS4809_5027 [Bacillus sp. ZZV12-4809]